MRRSTSFVSAVQRGLRPAPTRHVRHATTSLRMPAMSPTMTEGGIAGWKKSEGETFAAGDILLEIETDKATIDVEAQDDGIMGKILVKDGSQKIPVGQVIALLAEEGDDIASIEIPKDLAPEGEASTSSSPPAEEKKEAAPTEKKEPRTEKSKQSESKAVEHDEVGHGHKEIKHSKPLFPSVSRLLIASDLSSEQISNIKGTGKDGMLTKGDVLAALGQIKNAYGSAEKLNLDIMGPSGKRKSEAAETPTTSASKPTSAPEKPLDAAGLRRLIVQGLSKAAAPARPIIQEVTPLPRSSDAEFDAILAPYASLLPPPQPAVPIPGLESLAAMEGKGSSGGKKDEWAGLY